MDKRIIQFISKQTCATVCCIDQTGRPYCFSVFYAFDADRGLLFYKSANNTKHSPLLSINPVVAGTISPDRLNLLQIKGVQFEGSVLAFDDPLTINASCHYYNKHSLARTMPGEIWTIEITNLKFTDNTLGFGSKTIWLKAELQNKN